MILDFALGRNHHDAQFYVLDSTFSKNMADKAIYPAVATDPRPFGDRYYYANDHRAGGDFAWFADNLPTAEGSPRDEDVTAAWTFGGRWDPATLPSVLPFAALPQPENGWRFVDPSGVTLHWTAGRNARKHRVHFGKGESPELRAEQSATTWATGPLQPGATYCWRIDEITPSGIVPGPFWSFRVDPRTARIALAGDSTVTEKSGWGRGFKAHVNENAALLNLALGGRSGNVKLAPIEIDLRYDNESGTALPSVRNVVVERMQSAHSRHALYLRGLEAAPMRGIVIRDCAFRGVAEPSVIEGAIDLTLTRLTVEAAKGEDQP